MNKVALLFAGQGAQVVGMGKDISAQSRAAAQVFEKADLVLGYPLSKICFEGPVEELTKTVYSQPGIFTTSLACLAALREAIPNFTFDAAAGLSLGELTALTAAGTFSFEEGLRTVAARGRFMQESCEETSGTMAAIIGLDEAATRKVCDEVGVDLANLNCPGQIVISGEKSLMEAAVEKLKLAGAKKAQLLNVAGAYHSRLMKSAQAKLQNTLASCSMKDPQAVVISNVTAQPVTSVEDVRSNLVRQVTASVRWEESMRHLLSQGYLQFIELGPGTVLSGFMKRIDKNAMVHTICDTSSFSKTVEALQAK